MLTAELFEAQHPLALEIASRAIDKGTPVFIEMNWQGGLKQKPVTKIHAKPNKMARATDYGLVTDSGSTIILTADMLDDVDIRKEPDGSLVIFVHQPGRE